MRDRDSDYFGQPTSIEDSAIDRNDYLEFLRFTTADGRPSIPDDDCPPPQISELLEWLGAILCEGPWDPNKHPRGGFPQNHGWFSPTSGSNGSDSNEHSTSKFRLLGSGSERHVHLAGIEAVGHHWNPRAVIFDTLIRPFLSDDAVAYAMGRYSGATDPPHNNGPQGGVPHPAYSSKAKEVMIKFIEMKRKKQGKLLSVDEMKEIIDNIESGLDHNGKIDKTLMKFNNAVKKIVKPGAPVPKTMEETMVAGRKYMKHARFRHLLSGAILAGALADAVQAKTELLDIASDPRRGDYYRKAMNALEKGDIVRAESVLLGNDHSLYAELVGAGHAVAALKFSKDMETAFKKSNDIKP